MAETALREPVRLRPPMSPIAAPRAEPAAHHALVSILAHDWAAALPGAGAPPVPAGADSPERIVLTDLASRLVSILSGTPFEPDAASLAGRALVAADFTGPDVLGHILRVLTLRLPTLIRALPGIAAPDVARRLAVVTGALANGYVSALQIRTLTEQEALRRKALDAERVLSKALRYQATHDPLTGLPNRVEAFGRLFQALATAGPGSRVGLCYVDLDGFKAVNDGHGHAAGDQLLVAIAGRIGRVARAHGALAARVGGDEFIVLAEYSAGLSRMIALAADIIAEASRPVALAPGLVSVSACVGIVDRPAAGATAERVIQDADAALYESKSRGCGSWSVYQPVGQRAS